MLINEPKIIPVGNGVSGSSTTSLLGQRKVTSTSHPINLLEVRFNELNIIQVGSDIRECRLRFERCRSSI